MHMAGEVGQVKVKIPTLPLASHVTLAKGLILPGIHF